jgi:WD40 repeat protein
VQVIVRDIVSKQIIVQFQAHTSPISALCFDPSGTLLVTASIHGRNINVFRIIPPAPNSESDAAGTYFHLYKLQRGITNAVSYIARCILINYTSQTTKI